MGGPEISQFLSHLVLNKNVAVNTQKQALNALIFLYKRVLKYETIDVSAWQSSKKPKTLPVVFSKQEANQVIAHLVGSPLLASLLMYGAGLRLQETYGFELKISTLVERKLLCAKEKATKTE